MALPTAGTGAEQDQFWPMPKFYFSVDIGEFTDLPFQEVSGLDVETEVIEYRHGNSPNHSTIKMPGMMKYADITLKKGVFADDNDFYDWISSMTWTLTNAFPKQITPTDMNSQASEAAIETMVLAHEGMVAEVG